MYAQGIITALMIGILISLDPNTRGHFDSLLYKQKKIYVYEAPQTRIFKNDWVSE